MTTTVYNVRWHAGHDGAPQRSLVAVTEGYSTVDDIPRIIAVKRTGDPGLAYLVTVDSATPTALTV